MKFRGGYHDVTITTGGLNVFPRLVASEYRTNFQRSAMSSGIAELDRLLGGGGLVVVGAFHRILEATQSLADGGSGVGQPTRPDNDQHDHENDYEMGWSQSPHNCFSLRPPSRGPF